MRGKRDLTPNKVIKCKAKLNLHGGKQVYGVNYFETYAPVVTWIAIRLMIVFGIIFSWALWLIEFVMAYPQALIESDIYVEILKVSRQLLETPRTMYSSYSRTSTVRSKREECRIHFLWTISPHWAPLLY
jgi:hypothetical protein